MSALDAGRGPVETIPLLPFKTLTAAVLLLAGGLAGAAAVGLIGRAPAGRAPATGDSTATSRAPAEPPSQAAAPLAAAAGTDGYAAVARAVMPAVVNISSVQVVQTLEYSPFLADPFFRQFFGDEYYEYAVPRERRSLSLGSGVVVDSQGTILTNNHVVEHASEVKVAFQDGHERPARIVGVDARTDLAVLHVDDGVLPRAVMGDSDGLQVGDIVLAVGNPFGIGQTVTMGIVSALGRGNVGVADYEDFIQTDAAINPGNSGGALVNTRGEVVGINTAILSRTGGYQGIGFAIPSNMARDVLDDIVKTGRVVRGYAGIGLQRLTPEIARAFGLDDARGVLVASLDPRGPAAAAGLRRGDVIVAFRGKPVASDDDLRAQLARLKPGDRVSVGVLRNGSRLDRDLVLGDPPAPARPRRR
jgi:Do/DeqQ family serine protease